MNEVTHGTGDSTWRLPPLILEWEGINRLFWHFEKMRMQVALFNNLNWKRPVAHRFKVFLCQSHSSPYCSCLRFVRSRWHDGRRFGGMAKAMMALPTPRARSGSLSGAGPWKIQCKHTQWSNCRRKDDSEPARGARSSRLALPWPAAHSPQQQPSDSRSGPRVGAPCDSQARFVPAGSDWAWCMIMSSVSVPASPNNTDKRADGCIFLMSWCHEVNFPSGLRKKIPVLTVIDSNSKFKTAADQWSKQRAGNFSLS